MEIVLGALPSLLPKLGQLLDDEYNLQKEMKGGIMFLRDELESMKGALEHISKVPADQLPSGDKIWARNVREMSYDIEDNIDTFMVQVKGSEPAKKHALKKFIDKTLGFSLMHPKIRHKIAVDIRDMRSRVMEVHDRRRRYEVNHNVYEPVKVDPRALVRYKTETELVAIDEAKDEIIKILMEGNGLSKQQEKIVSIVGFGGLGKTTLASVVYKKLRPQFDCSAFVSVSQSPDMNRLFRDMFYQLAKYSTASINVIDELREFLRGKRYFIIIDDIWESSHWNVIRCAFPDDNNEYKIITTTRIFSVAKQIGSAYNMKPLSLRDSRILMYGRIFGDENKNKCPDEQLAEVSDRILQKCGGVPLAIIMIASLLATKGRNKLEWYDVCNSIGAGLQENNTDGLEESNSVEDMRKILSLSYYDMPSGLRTCLLYLSMFPEDYEISKDRLIRLWIAEGFIQSGKQEKRLFEIGENYFHELINRSMIQPIYEYYSGTVICCCVHDMVLDLVRSLSNEENFVTVWNNVGHPFESEKVRRLSIQNGRFGHGKLEDTLNIEYMRSVVVFPKAIDHVPTLENYKVLRVLDLEDCDLSKGYSLKYLGNLLHLRYLGLRNTCIDQIPKEIGKLRFLQTLEVQGDRNKISSLPSTIVLLTQLMCLHMDYHTRVPKGICRLTALENLSFLGSPYDSNIIEELGHLTELKELGIIAEWNNCLDKSLVQSLNNLHKIKSLSIEVFSGECNLDGWMVMVPHHLHRLILLEGCWLSTLPVWVDPSLLPYLSYLTIRVKGLQQMDLEILGRLPAIRSLDLTVGHDDLGIHGRFSIGACLFPWLVHCTLVGFGGHVVFQHGAMPRLAHLWLEFPLHETREINNGYDFGLGNLQSLRIFYFRFRPGPGDGSEEDVKEAKAVVTHAIQAHPNHPTFRDYFM